MKTIFVGLVLTACATATVYAHVDSSMRCTDAAQTFAYQTANKMITFRPENLNFVAKQLAAVNLTCGDGNFPGNIDFKALPPGVDERSEMPDIVEAGQEIIDRMKARAEKAGA